MSHSADHSLPTESRAMRWLRMIGADGVAWSLRRLHCPVSREALVLEVGSGGNPYPRANVLLDAYEETRERHWVSLVVDRPFVLGYVEHLPFKTGAFDFLIASHVLEHSRNPEQTLSEFQRVAKAGYIEVPDAFMERINPYKDHRLELTVRDGELLIRRKASWVVDAELVELYENRVKTVVTRELMRRRPFHFMVRYYWQRHIGYRVVNPQEDTQWPPPPAGAQPTGDAGVNMRLRGWLIRILRNAMSQRAKNREIDVFALLCCPACQAQCDLQRSTDGLFCTVCQTSYPIRNGIPIMYLKR